MRLYCATTNAGKLREFRLALDGVVDVETVPDLSSLDPPEETGATFEQNAVLKALYYAKFCRGLVFAEDSGLEVDALGGAPGVYSARFAGPHSSDAANNRLLLERMQGVAGRSAQFVSVIALADGENLVQTFPGVVEGSILKEPRGCNGFGYDPLFYYPPFGCTFGQAPIESKMQVSHRAQALTAMAAYLNA